jgi:hypothetical protein
MNIWDQPLEIRIAVAQARWLALFQAQRMARVLLVVAALLALSACDTPTGPTPMPNRLSSAPPVEAASPAPPVDTQDDQTPVAILDRVRE